MAEKFSGSSHVNERSFVSSIRSNPWILATFVLGILFVVTLFVKGGAVTNNTAVSEQEASSKILTFLSSRVNGEVKLDSITQDKGLYKLMVTYQGQTIPLYATLDGTSLVSDLVPLDGSAAQGNAGTTPTGPVALSVGDAPVIGDANAKVTVVKFSDFSCPYCAAASGDNDELIAYMKQNNPAWEPVVTNLMKDYVATGKVRFAVKYSMGHSGGRPAQLVSWCLNEQGLYWKFYSKAFANQDDVEDLAKMKTLAQGVGADMAKLQSCLDSEKYDARFDLEQNEGIQAGVQGTPAFFVGNEQDGFTLVSGAVPYSEIKSVIDVQLAK